MRSPASPKNIALFLAVLLTSLYSCGSPFAVPPDRSPADKNAPFRSITLSARISGSSAMGSLGDRWDPSAGARVDLDTPFYAGIIRAGVHLLDHDARTSELPDYLAAFTFVGWSYEWPGPFGLVAAAGVETGIFYMDFNDGTDGSREDESEIAFGIDTQVKYEFAANWSVFLAGDYCVVLTKREIEYMFAGAGLSRTFTAPTWFTEFFE